MDEIGFCSAFEALTGNSPFPWQQALYGEFTSGTFRPCNLPTGLGKTSVIPVWMIALAHAPKLVPRRLVYIVNRRTVVDQATVEAERFCQHLLHPEEIPGRSELIRERRSLAVVLRGLTAFRDDPTYPPVVISTLRGQFADNGEWRSDPARPSVVVGTIDMIGSRLLFNGYGTGYKSRPLHAGFLGHDALIVHDEAHLSKPFDDLLVSICRDQRAEEDQAGCLHERSFRVMPLTATSRGEHDKPFGLGSTDLADPRVQQRLWARKGITFHPVALPEKKGRTKTDDPVVAKLVELALNYRDRQPGQAIVIYVVRPEQVAAISDGLKRGKVPSSKIQPLTGTMRGYERDRIASSRLFARFQPWRKDDEREDGTVYLICTSAGEVGADISADHLLCDLTTFESMAQRLGRVNRRGEGEANIDVVHQRVFDTASKNKDTADREERRRSTLELLQRLPPQIPFLPSVRYDGSPAALLALRQEADNDTELEELFAISFSRPPRTLPVTPILFDAWALTSVREELPGRPPVANWLHGLEEEAEFETYVAWREEVSLLRSTALDGADVAELLDDYPLKPHELLRDRSFRVREQLKLLAKRFPSHPVWLLNPRGEVEQLTLDELKNREPPALADRTVILTPDVGGLGDGGNLDAKQSYNEGRLYDVADDFLGEEARPRVHLLGTFSPTGWAWQPLGSGPFFHGQPDDEGRVTGMKFINAVVLSSSGYDESGVDGGHPRQLVYLTRLPDTETSTRSSWSAGEDQLLDEHLRFAAAMAKRIALGLGWNLNDSLTKVLILAAEWHDRGKDRDVWQLAIGNPRPKPPLAKTNHGRFLEGLSHYRHEFGSLMDATVHPTRSQEFEARFQELFGTVSESERTEMRDLVLHLIAAHHGRGRPHFPPQEAVDPERPDEQVIELSRSVPQRYARLQRKYGRWRLAWLESLLRAADALASSPHHREGE